MRHPTSLVPIAVPRLARAFVALSAAALFAGTSALSAQAIDVAGEWEMEWETPRGARTLTFVVTRDGSVLGGTAAMAMMQREMEAELEGTVEGDAVTLTFEFAPPRGEAGMGAGRGARGGGGAGGAMGSPTFTFEGRLVDGELRGTLTPPRGEAREAVITRRPAG